jgi:hypothetical protein
MHTPDLATSDPDLAGLMVRCGEQGTEVLIVLLQPLPPRALPWHTIKGNKEGRFKATVAPPGTAVLLPQEAGILASETWPSLPELSIVVDSGQITVRGSIPLAGLRAALEMLRANCSAR